MRNHEDQAAVLYEMKQPRLYRDSRPLLVEEVEKEEFEKVFVEVEGAGLCHSDLSVIDGTRPRVMPMVLGDRGYVELRSDSPTRNAVPAWTCGHGDSEYTHDEV